jgi:hypothetical protein
MSSKIPNQSQQRQKCTEDPAQAFKLRDLVMPPKKAAYVNSMSRLKHRGEFCLIHEDGDDRLAGGKPLSVLAADLVGR